jgi:uncharacterized protein
MKPSKPRKEIVEYVEKNVFPVYEKEVDCHRLEHIKNVIKNSLDFAAQVKNEKIDIDMCYVIAAYHDIGISKCRETHEIVGTQILKNDCGLKKFFTEEQIETMGDAVADHRASAKTAPRTIYGKIVSSADRRWDFDDILGVMYRYRLKYSPNMTLDEIIDDARKHAIEKFGKNGYALEKMYFKSAEYKKFLCEIQKIAYDPDKFRAKFLSVNGLCD